MFTVLKFKKENAGKIEILYQDDLVARQSIFKRDGFSLGFKDDCIYLIVEGSEEAVNKAKELTKQYTEQMQKEEEEQVYRKLKEQDERSLEGMGSIFG